MNRNVLLITHYFPPVPGVGGRRWAKFVKYLSRHSEVNIHVVSAENTVKDVVSSFAAELSEVKFKHTILPSNYPKHLDLLEFKKKSTLYSKVMFRLQLHNLKKKVNGNYWDFSVNWEPHFRETIPTIIKENEINKLIISGPPYRYVKYALGLKKQFPNLELIIDYRDPWNDFNEPFEIGDERNEYERNLEKECLKAVDKVITVSEFQKALILKNEPNSAPVYVVPNGFDFEDYQSNIRQKEPSDKIRLVHFGTLHYRKDYYWIPFLNAVKRIKIKHPALCSKLAVEFVGYCPDQVTNYIAELDLDVKLHGILDPFKAYSELNQADIALWFKYDGSPGDFATKFGDYIALKKFIWTFSKPGEVTDYIAANKIGKVFYRNDENLEQTIYEALLGVESVENRTFNPDYNPSSLSIESLTEELLEVLCK